jgi:hypothetical protein
MSYPSQSDLLSADPLQRWVDTHFLRRDPFAFRDVGFQPVLTKIAEELEVDPNGIFCVGSGAVGLSVNPNNVSAARLRRFDVGSDLDVALISEVHFEQAWRDLRRATLPSTEPISANLEKHLSWQKKRFFDGVILANKLIEELTFGARWKPALVRIEEQVARALDREVDVEVWIYRDYWSVRSYVMNGIIRCREAMA